MLVLTAYFTFTLVRYFIGIICSTIAKFAVFLFLFVYIHDYGYRYCAFFYRYCVCCVRQSCLQDLGAVSTRFKDVLDFGFTQLVAGAVKVRVKPLVDTFLSISHNISEVLQTLLICLFYYLFIIYLFQFHNNIFI